ncbi:hypothetical protein ACLK2I_09100 [Escherichia coli]
MVLAQLPWFRATLAQWRYALRNTIAMCLALTVAYYFNCSIAPIGR